MPIKRPLPVLWSAKSATYCTKVHQSAPHHCPPQPIRRPLKHIKSPAGDHETANRFTPVSSTSIPTSPTPTLPSVCEARFKKREREGGVDPPFGWIEIIFHSWKPCQEILCLKNKSSPHLVKWSRETHYLTATQYSKKCCDKSAVLATFKSNTACHISF